ncbi:MAG: hypothetical protein KDM81_15170 [Verrucomicrobiae bacterium]|nr:hypothetical protein [Verrucomicrobiae bacterium]
MRFFLDNNLSPRVARALHCLTEPTHSVHHLKDRFRGDTPDVEWMKALAAESGWVVLSADTAISRNPHEVEAWKRAGHPIFFLKNAWVHQLFWEQAARLCHLFPTIIKHASKARKGDGFLVPFKGQIEGM